MIATLRAAPIRVTTMPASGIAISEPAATASRIRPSVDGRRLQLITDVGDAGHPTGEREPAGDEHREDGASRRPHLGGERPWSAESPVSGGGGEVMVVSTLSVRVLWPSLPPNVVCHHVGASAAEIGLRRCVVRQVARNAHRHEESRASQDGWSTKSKASGAGRDLRPGHGGEAGRREPDRHGSAEVLGSLQGDDTGAQGAGPGQVSAPDLHQLPQASGDRDGDVVPRVEVADVDSLAAQDQPPGPQLGRRRR